MPQIDYSKLLPLLVAYLVNVYEPCRGSEIVSLIRELAPFSELPTADLAHQIDDAIQLLVRLGYVEKTSRYVFAITPSGMRYISERRLAFARDKNRLYHLKGLLRRN